MAENLVATVQYTKQKSCFVQINLASWNSKYEGKDNVLDCQILKIVGDNAVTGYFGLSPLNKSSTQGDAHMFLNGLYAAKLGLRNKSHVSVQFLHNTPPCVKAWLEPVSVDDWEILEIHAQQVESGLLDQIRVLWAGQVFPLWVDGSVCIFLKTVAVEPASQCAVLMPLTDLIIEPKVNRDTMPDKDRCLPKARAQELNEKENPKDYTDLEVAVPATNTHSPKEQPRSIVRSLLRLTIVRKFIQMVSYILRFLWHKISSLASIFLPLYGPAITNKEESLLNFGEKRDPSSRDLPDNLDMVLRVEPMSNTDLSGFLQFGPPCINNCDQTGCVVLHTATDEKLCCSSKRQNVKDFDKKKDTCSCKNDTGIFLVNLQKLPTRKEQDSKSNASRDALERTNQEPEVVARLCIQALSKFAMIFREESEMGCQHVLDIPSCSLQMSSYLRRQLGIGISSKVRIKKPKKLPKPIKGSVKKLFFKILDTCSMTSKDLTSEEILSCFEKWLSVVADESHPIPITVGTIFGFPSVPFFSLENYQSINDVSSEKNELCVEISVERFEMFKNDSLADNNYFLLCSEDLSALDVEFTAADNAGVPNLDEVDPELPQDSVEGLVPAHQKLVDVCMRHAEAVLRSRPLPNKLPGKMSTVHPGCLLVTGPGGVGKSTMCRAFLRKLSTSSEYHAYVRWISCSSLRGKKPDTIRKLLASIMCELEWRQPSALLLDDIDHLLPSCTSPDGDRSPGAMYSLQLSAIIKDVLMAICHGQKEQISTYPKKPNRILVIVSASSQQSIHPYLLPIQGCNLLSKTIALQLPQTDERIQILRSMAEKHSFDVPFQAISHVEMNKIAQMTDGYAMYDFLQITNRAILSSKGGMFGKRKAQHMRLKAVDYQNALSEYTPLSLQDANLHKPKKASWSDVGGLEEVRKQLMEKLVWPIKYAHLFKTAGVHLQSGMLLFGPPGCGKTLLAGVVANECGLNFISVKGPELLSKYIGASEAAVRELFNRACAAAPCILFFDEFDSIAQKRGHDSTGVTDRVVNQILTHLDGVEPLSGVYVLAATSRPDLIDPALLRPGRLDTHLHCPMPDSEERCRILETLLSKMTLLGDIDVKGLAERSEHFTGADLRALVYDAQLKVLHGAEESLIRPDVSVHLSPVVKEGSVSPSSLSMSSGSPFATAELELEEHYDSNGMSSILKDLKAEDDTENSSAPLNPNPITVSDFTWTAERLVESVKHDKVKPYTWRSSDLENHYQICYGLSSPEFSSTDLPKMEKDARGVKKVQASPPGRSFYFPSLYTKQTREEAIPESVQNLLTAISAPSRRDQEADFRASFLKKPFGIRNHHLESALASARPSVSASERLRYLKICDAFTGKYASDDDGQTGGDGRNKLLEMRIQQRATLA